MLVQLIITCPMACRLGTLQSRHVVSLLLVVLVLLLHYEIISSSIEVIKMQRGYDMSSYLEKEMNSANCLVSCAAKCLRHDMCSQVLWDEAAAPVSIVH